MDSSEKNQMTSNRFLAGIVIGFIAGFFIGVLTESTLSNVVKTFSDSGDSAGLIFVKFLMFGFIGMLAGGFMGLLNLKK